MKSPIDALAASQAADRQHRKWRRARGVTGIGGLMLFASFFLPAVQSCNTPIVPMEQLVDIVEEGRSGQYLDVLGGFLLYGAAYSIGLFVAVACIVSIFQRIRTVDRPSYYWPALYFALVAAATIGFYDCLFFFSPEGVSQTQSWSGNIEIWTHWSWLWIMAGVAHLLLARRSQHGKNLCLLWGASVTLFAWFSYWFFIETTYYGLWLSMAGSALVFCGLTYEAMLLGRRGLFDTLGRLLVGRLNYDRRDEIRCECGYLLIGLPEPRCPECGLSFEPKRAAVG